MAYRKGQSGGLSPATRITQEIIARLEAGTKPWIKPWRGVPVSRPLRACGIPYRGMNVFWLWMVADMCGYASPFWMTYNQAKSLGAQVRKGEKSTIAIFYKSYTKEVEAPETGEKTDEARRVLKAYPVFNADQVEGLPERFHPAATLDLVEPEGREAELDTFFAAIPVNLRHQGSEAYYEPTADRVTMPPTSLFSGFDHYYATLAHELSHWTGHASRLGRDLKNRFGTAAYAAEELVVRRVGANKGVKTCLLDSWENPCVPDLPVPVMNRLKSRKRNGTIACREKAQTAETIVGRAGHRKVRTAKATLPELQSSGLYPRQRRSDGCSVAPRRNRDATRPGMKRVVRSNTLGPASAACPSSMGSKGRTERLTASHLLVRVNTGSPKWALQRPTWRQSRHSSQMPGVMPRTAIFGWTITDESCRATGAGLLTGRVKGGSACETGQPTGWAC